MTITNGYATLAQIKADMNLGVADSYDDARLEAAISAASRQVDAFTGRRFWQDATVISRTYFPNNSAECDVDDISTTSGLLVKVDDDDDGVFETTLTVGTAVILYPLNADKLYPVRPYDFLRIGSSDYSFPTLSWRPSVQVTAKFGWPAIPDDVAKATLIQAAQLFKASDAVFGVAQFAESGYAMRVLNRLNPMAEALLEPYITTKVA